MQTLRFWVQIFRLGFFSGRSSSQERSTVDWQDPSQPQANPAQANPAQANPAQANPAPASQALPQRSWLNRSRRPRSRALRTRSIQYALLFATSAILLTAAIGQRFYDQPKLAEGTLAPVTVWAPRTDWVEDRQSTDDRRQKARSGILPLLHIKTETNTSIQQSLASILDQGNDIRAQLRDIAPSSSVLSTANQQALRQASPKDWALIKAQITGLVTGPVKGPVKGPATGPNTNQHQPQTHQNANPSSASHQFPDRSADRSSLPNLPPSLQPAWAQLETFAQNHSSQDTQTLLARLDSLRTHYAYLYQQLTPSPIGRSHPLFNFSPLLLDLSDSDWKATQTGIKEAAQRILLQGIAPGMPPDLLNRVIELHVGLTVPVTGRPLAHSILQSALQPNLETDPDRTQQAADQAAQQVAPIGVSIKKGEPIVRAGEKINHRQFVLLDHFEVSKRGPNWAGLWHLGLLIISEMLLFTWLRRRLQQGLRRRDHLVIVLLATGAVLLLSLPVELPLIQGSGGLVMMGLLVGSFYGPWVGGLALGGLTLAIPLGIHNIAPTVLWPGVAGGLGAAIMAGRLRSREELALLGLGVGFIQALVYLFVALALSSSTPVWYLLLRGAAQMGLSGVLWSVLSLGFSPYLERVFEVLTPIRLAELANLNRPLLQKLAAQTPGTFQHTLLVATLAEAAARKLHCNVELIRAGTLYHDIGKMHDPLGFIENQMGGPNKHNELDNPWQSAAIIKKHVTEGLVIAKRAGLPKPLQAFIPEHQGTMLIAYFYHQAKALEAQDPEQYSAHEADFRYDGPIPQSRETGIVMLADSCEAALRSLKDATAEEALIMVRKIIRARWQDNQLVDSRLTRDEVEQIAQVFVHIWQQFHHQRITYPTAALPQGPALPGG